MKPSRHVNRRHRAPPSLVISRAHVSGLVPPKAQGAASLAGRPPAPSAAYYAGFEAGSPEPVTDVRRQQSTMGSTALVVRGDAAFGESGGRREDIGVRCASAVAGVWRATWPAGCAVRRCAGRSGRLRPGAFESDRNGHGGERGDIEPWRPGHLARGHEHAAAYGDGDLHTHGEGHVQANQGAEAISDTTGYPQQVSLAVCQHEHLEHADRHQRRLRARAHRAADRQDPHLGPGHHHHGSVSTAHAADAEWCEVGVATAATQAARR